MVPRMRPSFSTSMDGATTIEGSCLWSTGWPMRGSEFFFRTVLTTREAHWKAHNEARVFRGKVRQPLPISSPSCWTLSTEPADGMLPSFRCPVELRQRSRSQVDIRRKPERLSYREALHNRSQSRSSHGRTLATHASNEGSIAIEPQLG